MELSDALGFSSLILAAIAGIFTLNSKRESSLLAKKVDKLATELENQKRRQKNEVHITDCIAGALHELNKKSINNFLYTASISPDSFYQDKEHEISLALDKELTELGLFSEDKDRRVSAQRSIAHHLGDPNSLFLFQLILSGEIGNLDSELSANNEVLRKRLGMDKWNASAWTGRPSGGNF